MYMLAFLQAAPVSGWAGPTMAISLVVIALCCIGVTVVMMTVIAKLGDQVGQMSKMVASMQDDVRATVSAVRSFTEQGQDVLLTVRHEAGAFAQTSRRIRRKIVRGMDRIEERLEDLDALYDVVHGEVEDTALDVASTLRTIRTGNGMIGRVRRMLVPSR
jgi:methyl-accepting chemotaxis protein